ncbi:MAG TPA: nitrite/sulfite reductase [Myxococcales bacterium]|nr:nitrite/sulfite reductase [Myxococcales bacterium]
MASDGSAGNVRERASFGDAREAAEFVSMLEKFERGEIGSDAFRTYRLSYGIYGQRQDGVHMVRVKIPQGILSSTQLRVLADASERWSRGFGHLTTRQNVQFHFVKPESVGPMMDAIAASGLTTREACSHTVRNVTACAYAGVCPTEPFDATPYGEMVTRFFLRAPLGSGLPRKFKINLSGCADDCAQGAINDIGILARMQDGRRGFRLTAAGGLATLPRSGGVLHEFLPAEDLLSACEAILRVFNAEGNRKNLQKARLKWVIHRLGWEGFRALYQAQFDAVKAEGGRPLPPLPAEEQAPPRPTASAPLVQLSLGRFDRWRRTNVRAQRQPGYVAATAWLKLGDVSAAQLRAAADLSERHGDGTARTTKEQNLLFRWIRETEAPAFFEGLSAVGLGEPDAGTVADVVSCPGAESCRIAVTASRGVAQLLGEHLRERGAADGAAAAADIKVSGCPNGCGQHHVAAIGLQGGVRRLGERLVPQYLVTIGGGISGEGASFGRLAGKVPARRMAEAVDRLLALYEQRRQEGESPSQFFRRLPLEEAKAALADLCALDEASARPEDFVDLGSSVEFKVVTLDGECAA